MMPRWFDRTLKKDKKKFPYPFHVDITDTDCSSNEWFNETYLESLKKKTENQIEPHYSKPTDLLNLDYETCNHCIGYSEIDCNYVEGLTEYSNASMQPEILLDSFNRLNLKHSNNFNQFQNSRLRTHQNMQHNCKSTGYDNCPNSETIVKYVSYKKERENFPLNDCYKTENIDTRYCSNQIHIQSKLLDNDLKTNSSINNFSQTKILSNDDLKCPSSVSFMSHNTEKRQDESSCTNLLQLSNSANFEKKNPKMSNKYETENIDTSFSVNNSNEASLQTELNWFEPKIEYIDNGNVANVNIVEKKKFTLGSLNENHQNINLPVINRSWTILDSIDTEVNGPEELDDNFEDTIYNSDTELKPRLDRKIENNFDTTECKKSQLTKESNIDYLDKMKDDNDSEKSLSSVSIIYLSDDSLSFDGEKSKKIKSITKNFSLNNTKPYKFKNSIKEANGYQNSLNEFLDRETNFSPISLKSNISMRRSDDDTIHMYDSDVNKHLKTNTLPKPKIKKKNFQQKMPESFSNYQMNDKNSKIKSYNSNLEYLVSIYERQVSELKKTISNLKFQIHDLEIKNCHQKNLKQDNIYSNYNQYNHDDIKNINLSNSQENAKFQLSNRFFYKAVILQSQLQMIKTIYENDKVSIKNLSSIIKKVRSEYDEIYQEFNSHIVSDIYHVIDPNDKIRYLYIEIERTLQHLEGRLRKYRNYKCIIYDNVSGDEDNYSSFGEESSTSHDSVSNVMDSSINTKLNKNFNFDGKKIIMDKKSYSNFLIKLKSPNLNNFEANSQTNIKNSSNQSIKQDDSDLKFNINKQYMCNMNNFKCDKSSISASKSFSVPRNTDITENTLYKIENGSYRNSNGYIPTEDSLSSKYLIRNTKHPPQQNSLNTGQLFGKTNRVRNHRLSADSIVINSENSNKRNNFKVKYNSLLKKDENKKELLLKYNTNSELKPKPKRILDNQMKMNQKPMLLNFIHRKPIVSSHMYKFETNEVNHGLKEKKNSNPQFVLFKKK
ncbi:hypothetical protein A3Q56_05085 [Intoshia linei]|uniref:Uncharacterized protein n=1 Tax=Intoshia linei TaxID=1819745 RepID=A0A177AYU1_9BILA|nr:hypothetical protein A3Q56_05085 [Intoshia linei]